MAERRLPIGMQTFREVRERNCYYVDKTGQPIGVEFSRESRNVTAFESADG